MWILKLRSQQAHTYLVWKLIYFAFGHSIFNFEISKIQRDLFMHKSEIFCEFPWRRVCEFENQRIRLCFLYLMFFSPATLFRCELINILATIIFFLSIIIRQFHCDCGLYRVERNGIFSDWKIGPLFLIFSCCFLSRINSIMPNNIRSIHINQNSFSYYDTKNKRTNQCAIDLSLKWFVLIGVWFRYSLWFRIFKRKKIMSCKNLSSDFIGPT